MNKLAQYIKELGRTPIIPLAGSVGLQLTRTSMKTSLTDSGRWVRTECGFGSERGNKYDFELNMTSSL